MLLGNSTKSVMMSGVTSHHNSLIKNTARTVTLERSDLQGTYNASNGSQAELGKIPTWRTALYDVLTADANITQSATSTIISSKSASSIDKIAEMTKVRPEIDLLLDTQFSFGTGNTDSPFLRQDISKLSQTIQKTLNVLGAVPGVFGAIAGLASTLSIEKGYDLFKNAYSAAQAGSAVLDNNITSNDGTAVSTSAMLAMPWVENATAWTSPGDSPLFKYTFNFAMGQYGLWNAEEEVYKPMLNLMSIATPRLITAMGISGPFPGKYQLYGDSLLSEAVNTKDFAAAQDRALAAYRKFTWYIKFGDLLHFTNVIIKNCECTFSSDTDTEGFPIKGSATLSFANMTPMTLASDHSDTLAVRFGNLDGQGAFRRTNEPTGSEVKSVTFEDHTGAADWSKQGASSWTPSDSSWNGIATKYGKGWGGL